MTETQNIKAYKVALKKGEGSHWERGHLAAQWTKRYARERGDAAYAELVEDSRQSVTEHRHVAIEFAERSANISWAHHLKALEACGSRKEAVPWLKRAAKEGWSVRQMVEAVKLEERKRADVERVVGEGFEQCESLDALIETGKRFGTIYIDPPWPYENQATRAATKHHYETMSISDIGQLPISMLASPKSHLHLWTTKAFFLQAVKLMEQWEFEFKGWLTWVKPQLGIGNYWRVSSEFMLLGVKGGLTFPANDIKDWIQADRTKHSKKPTQVRLLIERVSPPPRLELFAREETKGWVVWGSQIVQVLDL